MELTLERPGDHLFVRSVSSEGILIADTLYPGPLIISASELLTDWEIGHPSDLSEPSLEPVFGLDPEIVLVGTGAEQVFPAPELMMCFYRRQVGVEFMNTRAACRTFNVLVSEHRRVVAALMPPGPRSPSGARVSP
ncbi:MAG: MTH938/NDUFAF3 family protein [Xanthomonadales bacterium]|jgi:uncharacterized protein|nr:MTH938/NDUFAF3 family protein [Xanthomonadales bacterium]